MNSVSILQRTRPMLMAAALSVVLFNLSCKPVAKTIGSSTSPEPEKTSESEPASTTESAVKKEPEKTPETAAATPTEPTASEAPTIVKVPEEKAPAPKLAVATFGNGCFWCTEAVMDRLDGVTEAKSGYMGGHVENPTYEEVCEKKTGHAEVVQVTYDPKKITYEELLDFFWHSHDPTTKDRQGNDVGPQYRSAIFVHSPEQKAIAENSMAKENASGNYGAPIVTEITDASTFWEAEDYHQDFFAKNPGNTYCRMTIPAKLRKLGLE